jgi:hypothetical protein
MRSINRALALSAALLITAAAGSGCAAWRSEESGVTQQQTNAAANRCRRESTKPFRCQPAKPVTASTAR